METNKKAMKVSNSNNKGIAQTLKSPLRYPGGKSKLIKHVDNLFPDFDEYREPFIGGGNVYLYLQQMFPERRYWINDLFTYLYAFWENAKIHNESLVDQINEWKIQFPDGKELFYFLRDNIDDFNQIEIASAFFILNRISFSGATFSGGYSKCSYNEKFTSSSIDRVKNLEYLLYHTTITNLDYQDVVQAKGNNTFIYLDPPYYTATCSGLYGKNGDLHKQFDHTRFAEVMKKCEHKWLITYDDCDYIRDLFSFAEIKPLKLVYSMKNHITNFDKNGNEIIITNY